MFIVDFVVGVCVAALAGLGVGGGGLLVIYLTLVKDMPQIEAQGINLLFFIAAGTASFFVHLKKRNINKKSLALMIVSGSIGAVAGGILINFISVGVIKIIFSMFLIISGIVELFAKSEQKGERKNKQKVEKQQRH